MNYTIDTAKRPIYLQLYRQLRDDIVAEIFPYNKKLPSKRSLAEETGVSTITVEHAYALLCDEGYVEARERSGFFVTFRPSDGFASTGKGARPLPLSQHPEGSYPSFPLSVLSKTARRVLSDQGELFFEKSPNAGCLALRDALRRYLARNRGIKVTTEQIVIGSGSEHLYGLIAKLLGNDKRYAIEDPSYEKIGQVYQAVGLSYELLPLTSTGIDSYALSACTADVLHTTPFRSYPSGVTATASKRYEYLQWASDKGRYLIEDDVESEFSVSSKPTETLFALSTQDNIIYLNTFSQTVSPSLRVAYMVLPTHLVDTYETKLGFYSCTVSTFLQHILTELIDNGDFERHINRVRRHLRKTLPPSAFSK